MPTFNTRFDFRIDTPPGKDPDQYSPTLKRYHKALWSRELPSGHILTLRDDVPKRYLSHESDLGSFAFSSDSVIPSYLAWKRMENIASPRSLWKAAGVQRECYTIGGMMIWPSKSVPGAGTINGMRGLKLAIADRFDLTIECVRRHYVGNESPLSAVLDANAGFFRLFGDFDGFVDFFLLQDLVVPDRQSIRFMTDFSEFTSSGLPRDAAEYKTYLGNARAFVKARNRRIAELEIIV
ncbi:hypothetical protein BXY47_0897 [Dietzia kunjamensis]|uniref:DUF6994 family protein n=1 Tax=Dietzia kunjamensis TaxID=322509 RepID=UPI000FECEF67|nr:hypothetical protein [Dietzia kunjamensis]MBB1011636.1 hypothetical protein [Dietzia kunjamensis]RKE66909.1 hypothetical protein BXY47_0897 [Dietzia kunjamensis]